MKTAREYAHEQEYLTTLDDPDDGCNGAFHIHACTAATAAIREAQIEALRWAASVVSIGSSVTLKKRIAKLEAESLRPGGTQ